MLLFTYIKSIFDDYLFRYQQNSLGYSRKSIKILLGTVACAFMFQRDSALSLVITILDIILIVFQSSLALYINMRALKQHNKNPIFVYRKLKILFVCFNTLDRLVVPIINCTLIFKDDAQDDRQQYCVLDIFVALIITAIIWNFIEYYFYTIVRDCVLALQRTEFRPYRNEESRKLKYDSQSIGMIYEVTGIKPPVRRGGQPIINPDKIEQGLLKLPSDLQRQYNQPFNQAQSFQVYGHTSELIEINLIQ